MGHAGIGEITAALLHITNGINKVMGILQAKGNEDLVKVATRRMQEIEELKTELAILKHKTN